MFFGRLCLQGNAVLPDGQLPVAQIFGAGGQTGGCGHHPIQQSLCGIIPRVPLHQRTGVEVDPLGLALGQSGVGGDLQRGDGPGKGRSPPSGEEHHVYPGRRQSGGGYQIVAGGLEHGQTPVLHPLTIGQHTANGGAAALLDKPNNNLAVEYCKAIIEQNVEIQPIALPRQGADHGQALTESGHAAFASASALRALWAEGGAAALAPYVPEKALKSYIRAEYDGKYTDFAVMGHCELALLRAACAEQAPFAAVRGVSEGLEHRLENAVRETASLPALLDALTTVRYPRARMRRLAIDAALGYTAQTPALPPYLHLLGARKEALSLLGETALPLSHSLARLARENETCAQMAAAQSRASDLGALCRAKPEPMGGIYRQKIIFLTN